MNTISRTITGGVIILSSVAFIVFAGFIDGPGIDYVAILTGLFFLVLGFYILFNKKEDQIEKIKGQEDNNKRN
jgi:hypothetical protein